MKRYAGFSMVELIIVILVLGIVSALISFILIQGFNSYFEERTEAQVQGGSLLTLAFLSEDIRHIRTPSDIALAAADEINFTDFNGDTIDYKLTSGQLTRSKNGGSAFVLANNVQTFALSYYDDAGNSTSTLPDIRYININFVSSQSNVLNRFDTTIYPRF